MKPLGASRTTRRMGKKAGQVCSRCGGRRIRPWLWQKHLQAHSKRDGQGA